MRLRLGIDLDGVVADFNEGWTRMYNRDFGTNIEPDDVQQWNAPVGLTHFASMSQFWKWARTCSDGASLFRGLNTYEGAVAALNHLARRHHIVIVTTKPGFAVWDTYEWIAENRLPTTEVHMVDDKTTVDFHVYLDDGDHNLSALSYMHPDRAVVRFVRPWNNPHPGVADVTSWEEFVTAVDWFSAQGSM